MQMSSRILKKDFELSLVLEVRVFGTRNGQLKFVFPTGSKIILKHWLRALRERCLEHRTQGPSYSSHDYLIQGASE